VAPDRVERAIRIARLVQQPVVAPVQRRVALLVEEDPVAGAPVGEQAVEAPIPGQGVMGALVDEHVEGVDAGRHEQGQGDAQRDRQGHGQLDHPSPQPEAQADGEPDVREARERVPRVRAVVGAQCPGAQLRSNLPRELAL
jgi:hypothetical protein